MKPIDFPVIYRCPHPCFQGGWNGAGPRSNSAAPHSPRLALVKTKTEFPKRFSKGCCCKAAANHVYNYLFLRHSWIDNRYIMYIYISIILYLYLNIYKYICIYIYLRIYIMIFWRKQEAGVRCNVDGCLGSLCYGGISWNKLMNKKPSVVPWRWFTTYCWWKKSCTTWDAGKPLEVQKYWGKLPTSTGAGFLNHQQDP